MDADEVLLALHPGGQTGDRQGGGVRSRRALVSTIILDLLEHLVLQGLILEDGLDHEVHSGQIGRVGGRGDPGQQRVRLFLGGLPAADGLGLDLLRVRLAALRRLQRDILDTTS